MLPEADIQHVGSTAIPDSLTKGDLDIQVRVPLDLFPLAVQRLGTQYHLNEGSIRTDTFAAFQDDTTAPPLGVQLSAIGSLEGFFWTLRDVFRTDPVLQRAYDALKQQYEGVLSFTWLATPSRPLIAVPCDPPLLAWEAQVFDKRLDRLPLDHLDARARPIHGLLPCSL